MPSPPILVRLALLAPLLCSIAHGQVAISGRVVDENGAAVAGSRVELRLREGDPPVTASSDAAGNFRAIVPAAGEYAVKVERAGFFLYTGRGVMLEAAGS